MPRYHTIQCIVCNTIVDLLEHNGTYNRPNGWRHVFMEIGYTVVDEEVCCYRCACKLILEHMPKIIKAGLSASGLEALRDDMTYEQMIDLISDHND